MNFPDDVFKNIMAYIHSSYKKPSHYEAILNQDDFYYLRLINILLVEAVWRRGSA